MKTCAKCKITKELSEFGNKQKAKDGLHPRCKICKRESERESYIINIGKRKKTKLSSSRTKNGVISSLWGGIKHRTKVKNFAPVSFSRKEFVDWIYSNHKFDVLFEEWKNNNFISDLKPSIDRINDLAFYSFDNIQLITWGENNKKGRDTRKNGENNKSCVGVIKLSKSGEFIEAYPSISIAARVNNSHISNIKESCKGERPSAAGFCWKFKT